MFFALFEGRRRRGQGGLAGYRQIALSSDLLIKDSALKKHHNINKEFRKGIRDSNLFTGHYLKKTLDLIVIC